MPTKIKAPKKPSPPKGWRQLRAGEIIRQGDMWRSLTSAAWPARLIIGDPYTKDPDGVICTRRKR